MACASPASGGEEAAPDEDGDGVADGADRCPHTAGLSSDGCPPRDTDGDGVLDRDDGCPAEPGPRAGKGCPDDDRDRDGVADRADACPGDFGHPGFSGCPPPDQDGDAVPDPDDRCAERAEVWNGNRDDDGCPDRGRALLAHADRTVAFAPALTWDGAELTPRSRRRLRVAVALLRRARARRVTVIVVAEQGASYGASVETARARADAVRAAVADVAVPAEHLEVDARGPDGQPRVELRYR